MLKRKMYDRLVEWKAAPGRKVLLLLGARQTGKTYIVREFAQESYSSFLEVNFLEDEKNGRFLSGAGSAKELFSRLSLIAGHGLEPGSLIFLDEVQHLGREVVTLSKFLVEDGRFDLVLSGSLLGTVLEGVTSFPVGYATIQRMHPLDFEEFCWALGVPEAILDDVRSHYLAKVPLEEALHDRLVELFRQYIVVGGMPEAVQRLVDEGRELGVARTVDEAIVEQYRYDIIKHAPDRQMPILTIFDNIPSQLAKENKRFSMRSVGKNATYKRLESDFSWLTKAAVALSAHQVSEARRPLLRTKAENRFKLYASDCGLLLSQYPQQSSLDVIAGEGDANFGAVYESVVAQQLVAMGFPLFYYDNDRKGEVDFLVETKEGRILPIEVKSGKQYKRHMALNNLMASEGCGIDRAYVLSEFNVSKEERAGKPVYYLPLYMTFCLQEERGDGLKGVVLEEVTFDEWA